MDTRKQNNTNVVPVGTYSSTAKLKEASRLRGNFSRVLKCGKTYTAQGTDKREICALLKSVLGADMPTDRLVYEETETVSRGRKTGKVHYVCTVSLAKAEREPAPAKPAYEDACTRLEAEREAFEESLIDDSETVEEREEYIADLEADVCQLKAENEALKTRLAELSAALEMLSAHATK